MSHTNPFAKFCVSGWSFGKDTGTFTKPEIIYKKVLLKLSQNSQKKTLVEVFSGDAGNFIRRRLTTLVFFCEFCGMFKNRVFTITINKLIHTKQICRPSFKKKTHTHTKIHHIWHNHTGELYSPLKWVLVEILTLKSRRFETAS